MHWLYASINNSKSLLIQSSNFDWPESKFELEGFQIITVLTILSLTPQYRRGKIFEETIFE